MNINLEKNQFFQILIYFNTIHIYIYIYIYISMYGFYIHFTIFTIILRTICYLIMNGILEIIILFDYK